MKKFLLVSLILISISGKSTWAIYSNYDTIPPVPADMFVFSSGTDSSEFPSLHLLQTALSGYKLLVEEQSVKRTDVITIIDFSLPSDKERLWVLDLIQGRVLFHCLVSHGLNSGVLLAEKFSNIPGSNASSPGFYTTGETYLGKHGLSLFLDGLEAGINDKARVQGYSDAWR